MKQSKVFKPILAILALAMVGGCAVKTAPINTAPVATQAAIKISGTLRINIAWPNSYNTALLPNSTNRVVVNIKKGSETIATKEVSRAAEPSISTTLKVDAYSGYDVEVEGYRDVIPVAHGAASGVTVKSGRLTTVPTIHMTALTVPAISAVTNNSSGQSSVAKVGDTITLQGTNLGAEDSLSLAISLNGTDVPAGNITRVGTGSIQVVVPDGATCGTMSVKVDNVPAVTNNPLWIVNSVSMPATASIVNHDHDGLLLVPAIGWVGNPNFGEDTPPDPLYSLADGFGTVSGNVFAPNSTSVGPVNITPTMGSLVGSSIAVSIIPYIDSVSLNVSTASINATSDGTEPSADKPNSVSLVATVNGDAFNHGVTWSSSDAALASVDANGLVTANNNGASGSVTITATSKDNSLESAQATITITNKGVVEVGVE